MQSLFNEVEKELPLLLERETDCRETWPKRWALLKAKVEKLKADNTQSTPCKHVNFTPIRTNKGVFHCSDCGVYFD